MNTVSLKPFSVVHYDYLLGSDQEFKYKITWKCDDIFFSTCGSMAQKIRVLLFLPESVEITVYYSLYNSRQFSYDEFKSKFKHIDLDLKFNCHGWTFTNGNFLLMDHFIPQILQSEYTQVSHYEEHDIVMFKCLETNCWLHSCKRESDGKYSHKDWIKGFYYVNKPEEILQMPHYSNTTLHFFKRKKVKCNLTCIRKNNKSIGRPIKIQ